MLEHEPRFPEVIDSTMLAALSCSRRFDFAYQRNYIPDSRKNIHLMAGGAFAKGLETMRTAWYQKEFDMPHWSVDDNGASVIIDHERLVISRPDDALEIGLAFLMHSYDESVEHNTAKTLDRMCGALEFYANAFPIDDPEYGTVATIADKPGIEWNFCVPLPVKHPVTGMPLLYAGRLDVILDVYAGRYLVDDKTTSSLGPSWPNQWDMRGQFVGYAWGAGQLGIQIDGSLVRGISILKTKYDSAQVPVHQPRWKIDEWLEATCRKLEAQIAMFNAGHSIPAFGEPCNEYGGCEFKQPCMVKDHEAWMRANYDARNWNPLERH